MQKPEWFSLMNSANCVQKKSGIEKQLKMIFDFMNSIEDKQKNIYIFNALSALCNEEQCSYRDNCSELYVDNDQVIMDQNT